jgi:hypothetical protein
VSFYSCVNRCLLSALGVISFAREEHLHVVLYVELLHLSTQHLHSEGNMHCSVYVIKLTSRRVPGEVGT